MISIRSVSFGYGGVPALRGVSADIGEGELVAIIGPNGSGKSTLLKHLARVLFARSGEVLYRGRATRQWNPKEYAREVGYLPQEPEPAFSMRALDVVVSGRAPYLGRFTFEGEADYAEARRALKLCDGEHLADRPLEEMSGGEKQRVFLARVVAGGPRLILLDEPFSGLDIAHTQSVLELLRSLVSRTGVTVVFVSHDLNWSAAYASRMLLMNSGRLAVDGPPSRVMTADTVGEQFAFRAGAVPAAGRDHAWIVPSPSADRT